MKEEVKPKVKQIRENNIKGPYWQRISPVNVGLCPTESART